MFNGHELVFTVDIAQRPFNAGTASAATALDAALDIQLCTSKWELVGQANGASGFPPWRSTSR
jgi:hypothetical protein